MIKTIYRLLIELTNRKWSSLLLQKFAMSKTSRLLIPYFIKVYNINMEEAELPYQAYPTLHQLFIRRIKSEARVIDADKFTVVSPVDGFIEAIGKITDETEFLVKGKKYSVVEVLGSASVAAKYTLGTYMVIYLSPTNYHRIHSPVNGEIIGQWELGKHSYPVNRIGLRYGKDPLAKNYRKVTELKYLGGHLAIVKVGAMFINSIDYTYKSTTLQKGEEIAYFSFGSTVILLFEKDTLFLSDPLTKTRQIQMGQTIGYIR
ncbi:phosphatidylserine decarboxylase [Caldibacillus lycopersici]|uniref:Phosphatidylserine decarboxylase proenzyme n=1 Tax=Perspicuibacillus lycopersici TaxID=1325689 RepID=A0AAE3IV63_9BACI|nr:phosphatidylserine decarboxylase [Perspicuibacillus lycopersici]MCU9613954.1 phosphatidylserine decarboxylase [Perspicuibacillus lycopersici]